MAAPMRSLAPVINAVWLRFVVIWGISDIGETIGRFGGPLQSVRVGLARTEKHGWGKR